MRLLAPSSMDAAHAPLSLESKEDRLRTCEAAQLCQTRRQPDEDEGTMRMAMERPVM